MFSKLFMDHNITFIIQCAYANYLEYVNNFKNDVIICKFVITFIINFDSILRIIVVKHGQETCASFLEKVNLPKILLNIVQLLARYLPATCRKTCTSRCCPRTCLNRAVLYSDKKTCASFLARDDIAIA